MSDAIHYTSNVEGLPQKGPFENINEAAEDARSRAQAQANKMGTDVGYIIHHVRKGEADSAVGKGIKKPQVGTTLMGTATPEE